MIGHGRLDRRLRQSASPPAFAREGDFVLLIGSSHNDLGGSEYLKVEHGRGGRPAAGARPRARARGQPADARSRRERPPALGPRLRRGRHARRAGRVLPARRHRRPLPRDQAGGSAAHGRRILRRISQPLHRQRAVARDARAAVARAAPPRRDLAARPRRRRRRSSSKASSGCSLADMRQAWEGDVI